MSNEKVKPLSSDAKVNSKLPVWVARRTDRYGLTCDTFVFASEEAARSYAERYVEDEGWDWNQDEWNDYHNTEDDSIEIVECEVEL